MVKKINKKIPPFSINSKTNKRLFSNNNADNYRCNTQRVVISPYITRLKFDITLFLSLSHRFLEILSFWSIMLVSFALLGLLHGWVFMHNIKSATWFVFLTFLLYSFVATYIILDFRFAIFRQYLLKMTKRNMQLTGYISIVATLVTVIAIYLSLFNVT